MYGIVGPSGSGKTTLLQCMGLLEKFSVGNLFIENVKINSLKEDDLANIRKDKIGFVFQMYYLIPSLSAIENVMLPLFLDKRITKEEREKRAFEMLKKVDLEQRIHHYPDELSGGEQQRVAIARALINNPSIILADEPTGNLDEKNELIILEILKKCAEEGKCVIIVSHSQKIFKYADKIIRMNKGKFECYE